MIKKKCLLLTIPILLFCLPIHNSKATVESLYWSPDVNFKLTNWDSYIFFHDWATFNYFIISSTTINFYNLSVTASNSLSVALGFESYENNVTIYKAGDSTLELESQGRTGVTGTILVYCASLGVPTSVTGATSYNYADGTLTLTANYPLPSHIVIKWGGEGEFPYSIRLLILIVGFTMLFVPLFVIFYQKPPIDKIILLLFVSFIGFALLMSLGDIT